MWTASVDLSKQARSIGTFRVCCTRPVALTLVVATRYVANKEADNTDSWWILRSPVTLHAVEAGLLGFEKIDLE